MVEEFLTKIVQGCRVGGSRAYLKPRSLRNLEKVRTQKPNIVEGMPVKSDEMEKPQEVSDIFRMIMTRSPIVVRNLL